MGSAAGAQSMHHHRLVKKRGGTSGDRDPACNHQSGQQEEMTRLGPRRISTNNVGSMNVYFLGWR